MRTDRWKLIRYPKIHKTQLFDLKNDPDELKDLSKDPAQANRVEDLMKLLANWQKETGDKAPLTAKKKRDSKIDLTGRKRRPDRHQPEWIKKKYFDN